MWSDEAVQDGITGVPNAGAPGTELGATIGSPEPANPAGAACGRLTNPGGSMLRGHVEIRAGVAGDAACSSGNSGRAERRGRSPMELPSTSAGSLRLIDRSVARAADVVLKERGVNSRAESRLKRWPLATGTEGSKPAPDVPKVAPCDPGQWCSAAFNPRSDNCAILDGNCGSAPDR